MATPVPNQGAHVEPMPAKPALTPDLPAPETVVVRSGRIACDGVGGALGHPRVWLEMGEATFVECPYCDRRFVLAHGTEGPEDERLAPGLFVQHRPRREHQQRQLPEPLPTQRHASR